MPLTPIQRRVLTNYSLWRDRLPSTAELIASNWRAYLVLFILLGGVCGIFVALDRPVYTLLVAGMLIGAISRDVGMFRRLRQVWPALAVVIDWRRVDEMLEEDQSVNLPS